MEAPGIETCQILGERSTLANTGQEGDRQSLPVVADRGAGLARDARSGVVERLAGEIAALVAAGDKEAALELVGTLGRLLEGATRSGADVVDLAAVRARRGRSG